MPAFEAVIFGREEKYIRDFLLLPKRLYDRRTCVQNEREEDQILRGTHILSKYFEVKGVLVYQGPDVAARCLITFYPDDQTAYIGFFECIPDSECADTLFRASKDIAGSGNRNRIVGPVNASFWIGYRLKTNGFDRRPYFGEPYNLSYYPDLFTNAGYAVTDHYTSNRIGRIALFPPRNRKSAVRYREFLRKGYTFVSPDSKTLDAFMHEIYRMISGLYSSFPIYKGITEEDFAAHFAGFRKILDYGCVKLVYFRGEAVGFTVGVPDYRNLLCGKIGIGTVIRLVLMKIRSGSYVSLYMGVMPGHEGLGLAMSEILLQFLRRRRSAGIPALIHDGKATKNYQNKIIADRNTYGLFACEIKEKENAK